MSVMKLGIIEGFYGDDWGFSKRETMLPFLERLGFGFFIYAPKADRSLRRDWQKPTPEKDLSALLNFRRACAEHNIEFGVGLSPYGLHESWATGSREALKKKLGQLKHLELDYLAILFDDMPGAFPQLAKTQAEIVSEATAHGVSKRYIMCPTYYSDAPILDRLFGARPADYLSVLGNALDPAVSVFWTGPKVVSDTYPDSHLDNVAEALGRPPFIWDNYPVNDGPRMCRHLHFRVPQRPASGFQKTAGWALNPMNQAHLSQAPLWGIAAQCLQGADPNDADLTLKALRACFSLPLADAIMEDIICLQDRGLDAIESVRRHDLEKRYERFEEPAATEILSWLKGEYVVSPEILTDC